MSPQFYYTLSGVKPAWLPDVKPKQPELGITARRNPKQWDEKGKRIIRSLKGRMRTIEICAVSHLSRTVVYNWLMENEGKLVQKHEERGGAWFTWSKINEEDDAPTSKSVATTH